MLIVYLILFVLNAAVSAFNVHLENYGLAVWNGSLALLMLVMVGIVAANDY